MRENINKLIDELIEQEEAYAFLLCGNIDEEDNTKLDYVSGEVQKAKNKLLSAINQAPDLIAAEFAYTMKEISSSVKHAMDRFNANMDGQTIGYNEALEWAASWIEGSLIGENNERVIEFTKAQAMSIRAAKKNNSARELLETNRPKTSLNVSSGEN